MLQAKVTTFFSPPDPFILCSWMSRHLQNEKKILIWWCFGTLTLESVFICINIICFQTKGQTTILWLPSGKQLPFSNSLSLLSRWVLASPMQCVILESKPALIQDHKSRVKNDLKLVNKEKPSQLFWTRRLGNLAPSSYAQVHFLCCCVRWMEGGRGNIVKTQFITYSHCIDLNIWSHLMLGGRRQDRSDCSTSHKEIKAWQKIKEQFWLENWGDQVGTRTERPAPFLYIFSHVSIRES